MATTIKSAKLEKTTNHLRQVRMALPTILREKIGTGHTDWGVFLQAVRDVDVDSIKDSIDIRNKEKAAIDQRFRMLESLSKSPTAPLRQQLSTVAISGQAAVPSAPVVGDPFANAVGGQGNLRFAANTAAF